MHTVVSLTVAESKRLIARGVAACDVVKGALDSGIVAVSSGTTNAYVIEELSGRRIDKKEHVTGRTLPTGYAGPKLTYQGDDLVLRNGERVPDVAANDYIAEMGPGDVFMKGANAINYERDQAAVLVGHPTGGSVGATLGTIIARRIHYLHPAGLEKSVNADLAEMAALLNGGKHGKGPTLWMVPGELFTEIEALETLAGVSAIQVGAGGVGGAEGAVWLAIFGDKTGLDRALAAIEAVRGELPFTET